MKPHTALVTLLASLAVAAWLAWPSRNQHGSPDMERLLGQCKTEESVTARLYEGNGGATTSYWYSVTLAGDALGKERQVFFSYAYPRVLRVECSGDAIVVHGAGFSRRIEVTEFQRLRAEPVQFWSGRQETKGAQPSRLLAQAAALLLAAAGVGVSLVAVAKRRRARNAA